MHLSEQAAELGVDALLVVTPYYNKPPQRGIVAHFEAIARASDLPIVVYNIPSRVVINIEPETITRLAEIETVRAVKQANDDLAQAKHIVETGLDLYAGDDNLIQPFVELGGIGGICVHTHVVGPQVAEQVRATLDGDVDRGRELDRELGPPTSCSRWRRTRSRSRQRSICSATRSALIACRSCRRRRRRSRASAPAWNASASSWRTRCYPSGHD